MEQYIYSLPKGQLIYEKKKDHIEIVKYEGMDLEITVPEKIENFPVTVIQKKAFLSQKNLRKVVLPQTIMVIEDWAFTYCDQLRKVVVPKKEITIGRNIFQGDLHLQSIQIENPDNREGLDYMLAASVNSFGTYQLLQFSEAGEKEWYQKWDDRLMQMMKMDDFDGYADLLICGEEDYVGKDYDEISYPSRKRMGKVRMAFFRLCHHTALAEDKRICLQNYLKEHTKNEVYDETWKILKEEKSEDMECFRIFVTSGCITDQNIDAMINDLKDENVQLRAALLNYKKENIGFQDMLDEFAL